MLHSNHTRTQITTHSTRIHMYVCVTYVYTYDEKLHVESTGTVYIAVYSHGNKEVDEVKY